MAHGMVVRRCLSFLLVAGNAVSTVTLHGGRELSDECIHRLDDEHRVESLPDGQGDVLVRLSTGERTVLPPCPGGTGASPEPRNERYYSDWVVDTVYVHEEIGTFLTNWTVPKAPTSRGPLPGMSSAYLFNGLENGGGVEGKATLILQPVLSYGKSGCILDPFAGWRFTAFQVTQAGRAFCGPSIAVQEGDMLQGRMELVDGGDTWRITADAGPRGRSVHNVAGASFHANAAYLTLEGMVIYSCAALPGAGVAWRTNVLADAKGRSLSPRWKTEIRHTQCGPQANFAGPDVEMAWNSTQEGSMLVV